MEYFHKQQGQIQKEIERLKAEKQSESAETSMPSIVHMGSKSITSAAVRPILLSDGFFKAAYAGTVMKITVDIWERSRPVLVNTATTTGVDFQTSTETAVKVAQQYTKTNLSDKDIVFSVSSENEEKLQAVDGPSARMVMPFY